MEDINMKVEQRFQTRSSRIIRRFGCHFSMSKKWLKIQLKNPPSTTKIPTECLLKESQTSFCYELQSQLYLIH